MSLEAMELGMPRIAGVLALVSPRKSTQFLGKSTPQSKQKSDKFRLIIATSHNMLSINPPEPPKSIVTKTSTTQRWPLFWNRFDVTKKTPTHTHLQSLRPTAAAVARLAMVRMSGGLGVGPVHRFEASADDAIHPAEDF